MATVLLRVAAFDDKNAWMKLGSVSTRNDYTPYTKPVVLSPQEKLAAFVFKVTIMIVFGYINRKNEDL